MICTVCSRLGAQSNRGGEEEVGDRKSGSCAGALWDTGRAEQKEPGEREEGDAAREE